MPLKSLAKTEMLDVTKSLLMMNYNFMNNAVVFVSNAKFLVKDVRTLSK